MLHFFTTTFESLVNVTITFHFGKRRNAMLSLTIEHNVIAAPNFWNKSAVVLGVWVSVRRGDKVEKWVGVKKMHIYPCPSF